MLVLPGLERLGQAVGVSVNGMPVPSARGWLFDVTFAAIDIAALVKQGENHIALLYDDPGGPDLDKTINPAMLAGSFSLDASWSKLRPPRDSIPTGSWTDNGYPFYSGTAVYSQTVDIPAFHQNQTVLVRTEDAPDVIEFIVNDACAGVRAWTPYESDITHLIKPGPNRIELRVTNTSANALGQEPIPSGLLSAARLIIC